MGSRVDVWLQILGAAPPASLNYWERYRTRL